MTEIEKRLLEAINWAMGCHPIDGFREKSTNEGQYYWRKELAERAGIEYDQKEHIYKFKETQPEDSADRCVCPNCGQPHNPKLIKSDQPMQDKHR